MDVGRDVVSVERREHSQDGNNGVRSCYMACVMRRERQPVRCNSQFVVQSARGNAVKVITLICFLLFFCARAFGDAGQEAAER